MSQQYSCLARVNEKYALPDVEVFYAALVTCDECDTPLNCTGFNAEDVVECGCGASADQSAAERGWWYQYCLPGCMPDSDAYGPYDSEEEAVGAMREDTDCDCDTCCGHDRYGYLMRDGMMLCPECSDEAEVHHCSGPGFDGWGTIPDCARADPQWCILMAHDAEPGAACAHCGDVWMCDRTETARCEWGGCEAAATTQVAYPAVVPGTAGRARCWECGEDAMAVCDACAKVARAEVADCYHKDEALCPRHEEARSDRCHEWTE